MFPNILGIEMRIFERSQFGKVWKNLEKIGKDWNAPTRIT